MEMTIYVKTEINTKKASNIARAVLRKAGFYDIEIYELPDREKNNINQLTVFSIRKEVENVKKEYSKELRS